MYIKLDSDMNLVITAREPIYRGDNLARKIVYLIPMMVGDIDMLGATVYLSYIRADGTADIVLLERMEESYNEAYHQYRLPVTSTMSRYAGELCTWIQIYSGDPRHPVIAKSGECMMNVMASKNMDEYISDRNLSLIYMMQKHMEDKIEKTGEELGERIDETNAALEETNAALEETNAALEEGLAAKADGAVFDEETHMLQLMSGDQPVGEPVELRVNGTAASITGAEIRDGSLVITFDNGTEKDVGRVVGKNGGVYVPHVDEHSVLTFTFEEAPEEDPGSIIPPPLDMNPNDEWSDMDDEGESIKTPYVWEGM